MSLYNMMHGINPLAAMVLAMLGTKPDAIPRFRDAYFDGEHLCIYTRTGGGNREAYDGPVPSEWCPEGPYNSDLRALPGFLHDEDDDYDSTYATFYFAVPERFAWFKAWASDKTERPASERWAEAIERIKTAPADDPVIQRLTKAMQPVVEFLSKESP